MSYYIYFIIVNIIASSIMLYQSQNYLMYCWALNMCGIFKLMSPLLLLILLVQYIMKTLNLCYVLYIPIDKRDEYRVHI